MQFEEGIFEYLTTDPNVASIVEDRIYPVRLPAGAEYPAVSWQKVSADRYYTHDTYESADPWVQARIQVNAWAKTEREAMLLGDAVLLALSGFEGNLGGQLVGSSFAVNEQDVYESQTTVHRRILDFIISYEDDALGSS